MAQILEITDPIVDRLRHVGIRRGVEFATGVITAEYLGIIQMLEEGKGNTRELLGIRDSLRSILETITAASIKEIEG